MKTYIHEGKEVYVLVLSTFYQISNLQITEKSLPSFAGIARGRTHNPCKDKDKDKAGTT